MSLLRHFSIVTLSLSSFNIFAQQSVDVFPDGVYIQENHDLHGRGIIKINPDLSVKHFLTPVLPKDFDPKIISGIRPKIRLDNYWISDRQKIYKRPLDVEPGQEWELVKLPDGIEQFSDFEIISDKEAIICDCVFKPYQIHDIIPRLDKHVIFNYKTGTVTTTIESLDLSVFPYAFDDIRNAYIEIKLFSNYMCRFDSRIIIVGEYSGLVTVLDINPDDGKLRRSRKFMIIPEDELPREPGEAVKGTPAIAWIGPLSNDNVLICCRMWVPDNNPAESVITLGTYCFRTLNLGTGKVNFEGSSYRDRMAERFRTLYEENGELLPVRDVINEHLKQIEQAKKPKSALALEQTEKQVDQPPKS